jgi:hypothetical protein
MIDEKKYGKCRMNKPVKKEEKDGARQFDKNQNLFPRTTDIPQTL